MALCSHVHINNLFLNLQVSLYSIHRHSGTRNMINVMVWCLQVLWLENFLPALYTCTYMYNFIVSTYLNYCRCAVRVCVCVCVCACYCMHVHSIYILLQSERGGHTLVLETSDKQQLRANLSSPPVSCTALCTITKQHLIRHMYSSNYDLYRIKTN